MRLIDADALMNDFRAYMAKRHDRERCVSEKNCKTCVSGCLWREKIFAAPTIEAKDLIRYTVDEERRRIRYEIIEVESIIHAHWIIDGDWGECSHCHEASKLSVMEHKDYCPACGAIMDEEDETNGR